MAFIDIHKLFILLCLVGGGDVVVPKVVFDVGIKFSSGCPAHAKLLLNNECLVEWWVLKAWLKHQCTTTTLCVLYELLSSSRS